MRRANGRGVENSRGRCAMPCYLLVEGGQLSMPQVWDRGSPPGRSTVASVVTGPGLKGYTTYSSTWLKLYSGVRTKRVAVPRTFTITVIP